MRWACEPDLAYPANLVSQFKDANLDQLGDGQVFESLGLHAFDEVRSDFGERATEMLREAHKLRHTAIPHPKELVAV